MTTLLNRAQGLSWIACPTLFFVVMFAHMTAIENVAIGMLAVATLAAALAPDRPSPKSWPVMGPILLWASWGLLSLGWSVAPLASLHGWLDEICYPSIVFFGFWLHAQRSERPEPVVLVNWVACALLAMISAIMWGQLQPGHADAGLLHFYNRVGHTSTLVMFSMPLFTGLLTRGRMRWFCVTGLLICLFVGFATLNRFFWAAAFVTLIIALFPAYRRHLILTAVAMAVIGAGTVGTLELSSRMRFGSTLPAVAAHDAAGLGARGHVSGMFAGIDDTVSSDTRPKLWAFYGLAGKAHPWMGVGFGKTLPGAAYGPAMPPNLLTLEPQARTHAHNLFLNTWLEVGVIGVVLQVALLAALVWRFARLWRTAPWTSAAGLALVCSMIVKNMIDDFMWQTTMLAFWSFAGWLLGSTERSAGSAPPEGADADAVIPTVSLGSSPST